MSVFLRAALLAGALVLTGSAARAAPLTIEQAIAKAVDAAPAMRAGEASIEAARASRLQADVRPNPSVSVEAENFVGTGPFGVLRQAEITAEYSQPFERGGKRAARVALAEREVAVAEAARTIARLELIASIERAYIDVLIADRAAEAARDRLSIEQGLQREALRRVRGYKDPLFVETRAAARVADAAIARDIAETRRGTARSQLASFWGGDSKDIEPVGELARAIGAGPVDGLANADAALIRAEADRAAAAVALEQTRATQDFTVSGGARFHRESNAVALVAGVSIPLGRFDRNQGNIARAQAEQRRIAFAAEAARLDRQRRLTGLQAEADAALVRSQRLRAEVLPRARRALVQVREGYNRGGFSFRDIQDAADAIIAADAELITALTAYRDVQSDIDRLTGRFDAVTPTGTRP